MERDALRRIVIHVFRGDDVIGRTLVFDPLIEGREDIVSGIGGVRPVDPLTERIWTGSATAVSHPWDHEETIELPDVFVAADFSGHSVIVVCTRKPYPSC